MNHFCLTGLVYEDCTMERTVKGDTSCCKFIICIGDHFNKGKSNYIPLVCYGTLAEKCSLIARQGNTISVCGELTTTTYFDKELKEEKVRVYFVLTDAMLIAKKQKYFLTCRTFSELIDFYLPSEYVPHNVRTERRELNYINKLKTKGGKKQ